MLAALALTTEEFSAHMCVPEGAATVPAFYSAYVAEIQEHVTENATLEFECLWAAREATGTPLSLLSDELSNKIVGLSDAIERDDGLWANVGLREHVLHDAIPRTLADLVGGPAAIIARLPTNYLRALFGSRLASRFVYESGLHAPEFAFFTFASKLAARA